MTRRHFLQSATLVGTALAVAESAVALPLGVSGKSQALFDGTTLRGWRAVPRLAVPKRFDDERVPTAELTRRVEQWYEHDPAQRAKLAHRGRWEVVDGAIVGGQEPAGSGLGAYLLS